MLNVSFILPLYWSGPRIDGAAIIRISRSHTWSYNANKSGVSISLDHNLKALTVSGFHQDFCFLGHSRFAGLSFLALL